MKFLLLILTIFLAVPLFSQVETEALEGNVTFINHLNVYVSFVNTAGIKVGDSLYVYKDNKLQPVLVVTGLSSSSCVGKAIGDPTFFVTNKIVAAKRISKPIEVLSQQEQEAIAVADAAIRAVGKPKIDQSEVAHFEGRFSVSSYSTITNNSPDSTKNRNSLYRMRYNLDLNAQRISNSKVSFETSLAFTHRLFDYNTQYDGLRIYDFAVKYDLSKTASITAGRKINLNMANVGAVDGVQFEKKFGGFSAGAILGSRPNDSTYGFDAKLVQYGAFIAHDLEKETGYMNTTFAIFNQTNNFVTDRRYAYFQHSNSLLKNVDLFCSVELDLYKLDRNLKPTSTIDLTGTYASIRYRPWRQLSMAFTYDARNNIYYYETYKKPADSIFDKATRQGYKFQTTVRPFKNVVWGSSAGYRLNPKDTVPALNGNSYVRIENLPFINSAITFNATALKSMYLNGVVYGVTLSRDIIEGKLYAEVQYKKENYEYKPTTTFYKSTNFLTNVTTPQNVAELSLDWRFSKKLIISADFEAVFAKDYNYGRIFLNLSHRF